MYANCARCCHFLIKKDWLRWFGRVECKDDVDLDKCCMMMGADETRNRKQDRGGIRGRLAEIVSRKI